MKYNPATGEMDFSLALKQIKQGRYLKRKDWDRNFVFYAGGGIYLGDEVSRRLWIPAPTDLLAEDWIEVI